MQKRKKIRHKQIKWQDFWSSYKLKKIKKEYFLFDVFRKYLKFDKNKTCIEIGCFPGNFLVAFNKNFGYRVFGIDIVDKMSLIKKNLDMHCIREYGIYKKNLLDFNPKKKFDVVSSFGLIEHFSNPKKYIDKMLKLLKPGGYFIMGLPSIRYFNYFLHNTFDKPTLRTHYLTMMDLRKIENIFKSRRLKTIHLSYYRFFEYSFTNSNKLLKFFNYTFLIIGRIITFITDKLSLNLILSNKYLSPYIIYIGQSKKKHKN